MLGKAKIKEIVKNNKLIFENLSWLTLLQVGNYMITLFLIPYIARVVGEELFGRITLAQSIVAYLTVLVNFGFEYSATQEITIHKNDIEKVSAIFWNVIRIKIILLIVSFIIMLGLLIFSDKMGEDRLLYAYASIVNIGIVLFPIWFFQGMEKMKNITIFNFLIKLITGILVVIFVRQEQNYRLYLLILSLSYITVGAISLIYAIKKYNISFIGDFSMKIMGKSLPIFLNNLFATVYSTIGLVFLGRMVIEYQLGIYSAAYKTINAVLMIISTPITMALFPAISHKFAISIKSGLIFYKKVFAAVTVLGVLIMAFLFIFASPIINILFTESYVESAKILRILSPIPLLVLMASMLTVQGLYGLRLQKYAPYIGGVICTASIILNYYMINSGGIYGASYAYLVVELMEILIVASVLLCLYKKLNK